MMPEILTKIGLYALTAGAAAVVDAGGFALLVQTGMAIPAAGLLSFGVAAVVNYLLTSRIVFGHQPSLRGFALFLSAALVGLSVNVSLTVLGVYALGLQPVVAKLLGIGTAFFVNCLINLCVVFPSATHAGEKKRIAPERLIV